MKSRWVCLPIESITSIFADYASEIGFPADAKPVRFMLNPQLRKMMLVIEAESLTKDEPAEDIKFSLKRVHSISGGKS